MVLTGPAVDFLEVVTGVSFPLSARSPTPVDAFLPYRELLHAVCSAPAEGRGGVNLWGGHCMRPRTHLCPLPQTCSYLSFIYYIS